jgi:hypothetical protein
MTDTTTPTDQPLQAPRDKPLTPGQALRKRALHHKGLMFGAVVMLIVVGIAIFAPLLTQYDLV